MKGLVIGQKTDRDNGENVRANGVRRRVEIDIKMESTCLWLYMPSPAEVKKAV